MNLDNIAINIAVFFVKSSTAITFEVLLVIFGLYLMFFEDSPYGLIFQAPIVAVCLIANGFWIMELKERERKKNPKK